MTGLPVFHNDLASAEILRVLGHTARIVASGEEALAELAAGLLPHGVILDLAMPGLGGEKTLPLLRAMRPTLPVMIATGRNDPSVRDLEAQPFVTLLLKPFTFGELRQRLEALGQG
jgi:CheY-like chemotaxis protein